MGILRRVTNLWRRGRLHQEIEEELRAHVEMAAEDAVRAGAAPEEARRAARLRFGNGLAMRERTAAADTLPGLEATWRDVHEAVRQLRRSPAFTVTATITLALGIGATTAIFTLVQQVMLRSLPVARPEQLWRIGDVARCCYANGYAQNDWNLFSWEAYKQFRRNTPEFEELAAFQIGEGNAQLAVRRAGSPAPMVASDGEYVSGNFFRTFGISAWRGRLFTDADDREGAPPVTVMSFRAWQSKFGSDPSAVGATYSINGQAMTAIGVAPPGFFGAKIADSNMPDFWLPLTAEPLLARATSRLKNPRLAWLDLIGRVRPGTNPKTLEAQLDVELHQWLASHATEMTAAEQSLLEKQTLYLTPGGAGVSLMREDYKDDLRLLTMAALCVLLVACANVANLLLARGLKRRFQTALRAALGASRLRLVWKALVESLTLGVFGAAAGIGVAYAGARLILRLAFRGPVPVDATPSAGVLLFALGISLVTAAVFGIAPAWMSAHADPIEALRGAGRSLRGGQGRTQKTLAIAQAAVSIVLLSAAAMLGQSLRNLEHQNFGFETKGRYLVSIDPKISNYKPEQLAPLFRDVEDRLRAIPGVRSAGGVLEAPLTGWVWPHDIGMEGKPDPGPKDDVSCGWTRVTPGFFQTYQDKMLAGRPITASDNAAARPVAVVNEAFAKKFLGSGNPIGRHFGPLPRKNAGMYEIIGVAADLDFGGGVKPMYFLPEAQATHFEEAETENREVWSHYLYNFAIWAPGHPQGLQAQVRRAVADAAPDLAMYEVRSYGEVIRGDFARQNMIASLTWLFGAVGLVLAAVGLYGVTAYGVERRTGEIGVRMALGADRATVLAMVLRGAFWQAGAGLALGIPAAIAAGDLIASHLFGVKPWDPLVLAGAAVLLGLAALIAAFFPARRAAGVDPVRALRAE